MSKVGITIVDVEELILKFAQERYEKLHQRYLEKKQKRVKWKDVKALVDWSEFIILHGEPVHAPKDRASAPADQASEPTDHTLWFKKRQDLVVFESIYSNKTDTDMKYTLSTTRQTRTTVSGTITKGFRCGADFKFQIGAPAFGAGVSLGASCELSFQKNAQTTREQEMSWIIDTVINVPRYKQKYVKLIVKEKEYEGTFRAKTYFRGKLCVYISKGNTRLVKMEVEDMGPIFTKERGFEYDQTDDAFSYETKGTMSCRFGVEQSIMVSDEPILDTFGDSLP